MDTTQRRGYQLRDLAMVSPEEGWAVGSTQPNQNAPMFRTDDPTTRFMDPVLLHYQQGRWDDVPFPAFITPHVYGPYMPDIRLSSISMVSAAEGWAVGSTVLPNTRQRRTDGSTRVRLVHGSTFGVLLHYRAGQWGATYKERAGLVSSVSMTSAEGGWIVGGSTVLRYTGSTWTCVRDPALAQLLHAHRVVAVSPEDVWVVGVGSRHLQGSNGFDGTSSRLSCTTMAESGQSSRAIWPILASLTCRCFHPRKGGLLGNCPGAWAYTRRTRRKP